MGWDAYSSAYTITHGEETYHPVFERVSKRVAKSCGGVDGLLSRGGLDCGGCGQMLEKATSSSVYDDAGWSSEQVRQLRDTANWDFEVEADQIWYKESARAFLSTCADLNLSIKFSW